MPLTNKPFYYLDNLVNVLLVDDDMRILSLLSEILRQVYPYHINSVTTAQQAEKILSSPARIHLCVLDLGITDIKSDEFFLLKQFGTRISFIILTGRSSPLKGFEAHTLGAKAVIEKTGTFNNFRFLEMVNHLSLLNIINPKYNPTIKDSLSNSTDLLFKESPKFVSQWAQLMGMTDRTLRHIWTKNLGANAKIILSIYQMFETAFDYFEKVGRESESYKLKKILDSNSSKRLEEFFHMHKSTITDFIAYGNVAAFL